MIPLTCKVSNGIVIMIIIIVIGIIITIPEILIKVVENYCTGPHKVIKKTEWIQHFANYPTMIKSTQNLSKSLSLDDLDIRQ